jgi:hypothetical protein
MILFSLHVLEKSKKNKEAKKKIHIFVYFVFFIPCLHKKIKKKPFLHVFSIKKMCFRYLFEKKPKEIGLGTSLKKFKIKDQTRNVRK